MVENLDQIASRRDLIKTAGGGSLALLAGCLGQRGGDSGSKSKTVKFWTTNTENNRLKVIKNIISNFEKSKNSKVKLTSVAEDDLPSQISSARASDTLPSIGEWGLEPMQQLGESGLLSKKAAKDVIQSVGADEFYEGALALTQASDGGHFAVPHSGWLEGFWYSKSVFEKNGLNDPTSWDSLLAAAKALHKPDQNQFGIVVGTKKTAFARQCFTPFARSNGARVFNEKGKIVFDSPQMVEALDFYGKLAQYTPPGQDTWKTANHTYLNDQCHLVQYSTFIMGDVAEKSQKMVKDTGFAPYIEHKRKSSYGQIVTLSLLSGASKAEQKGSVNFGEYILTGKQYIKWLHMTNGGAHPVIKSTAKSDAYKKSDVLQAWGSTVEDVSAGFANIERFGYMKGKSFPEFGKITNKFLVAEAVSRVADGEPAKKVASEQAKKMRDTISS